MDGRGQRIADIVVFGATGFTGAWIARRLAREAARNNFVYGIAGRSASRLNALVDSMKAEGLKEPAFIAIADIDDDESLKAMASKARVLINAVGPYRFYGEPVVRACVAAGTDYLDITGEPEFMERMVNLYDEEARRKGVIVANCCAFDSIPADVGALKAAQLLTKAGYVPTSVVGYLSLKSTHPSGVGGHFATFESAVHGVGSAADLSRVRKEFAKKHPEQAVVPAYGGKPVACLDGKALRKPFFFSEEVGRWVVPFPGSDASVVRRTQRSLLHLKSAVPFSFATFATLPSTWAFVLMLVLGLVFSALAKFPFGRKLLLRYPGLFSNGVFSHEGPSADQIKQTSFTYRFVAVGHTAEEAPLVLANPKVKSSAKSEQAQASGPVLPPATARAVLEIQGTEPGYDATSAIVTAAAISVLNERSTITSVNGVAGGVVTPGVLFRPGTPAGDRLAALVGGDGGAGVLKFVTLEEPHLRPSRGSASGGAGGRDGKRER